MHTHLQSSSHPFEFQYFRSDHSCKQTAQSAALTAAVSPSFPPRLCPSTSLSTCQHFTHSSNHSAAPPLCQGLSTTHRQAAGRLSPCAGLPGGGAVEGRCPLQLVMRSVVSTSQRLLLLFTVANEGTSGSMRGNPAAGKQRWDSSTSGGREMSGNVCCSCTF